MHEIWKKFDAIDNVKFYDELNIGYGTEEEKEIIRKELEDELSGILSTEELEVAILGEINALVGNKDISVRLLTDYRRWGPSTFVKGAIGVVRDWRFFRYLSNTWYYAYVLVEINGDVCAVNIDKLEVLDEKFLEAERNYFRKFKDTYEYIPSENTLKLNDEIEIHCKALVNRILEYLEDED